MTDTTTAPADRFQVPEAVQQNQQLRARARRRRPCLICDQDGPTVLYPAGWHCPPCAAQRGLQPVNEQPQETTP